MMKPSSHPNGPRSRDGEKGYVILQIGSLKSVDPRTGSNHYKPIMECGHRLVCAYAWGKAPDNNKMCVLHTCSNPACLQPHHLLYGSIADNNLKGTKAIIRCKRLSEEQGRLYWGKGWDMEHPLEDEDDEDNDEASV